MADRNGIAIALGTDYLVVGTARKTSGTKVVLLVGTQCVTVDATEIGRVDDYATKTYADANYVSGAAVYPSTAVLLIGNQDQTQLEVWGYDLSQSLPVVAIRDNGGNALLQVNIDGTVSMQGAVTFSSSFALNQANTLTVQNKTLDSTNHIQDATGHRFWIYFQGTDLGAALTQIVLQLAGLDSITYPGPVIRACKIVRAAVTIMHADSTSPPATWTLDVFKNGASASTMTFNLNASPFVDTTTTGAPSAASWAAGDRLGAKVRGTSLDAGVVRVALEMETT